MSALLKRQVLQQYLLEARVMSCSSNSYYKKFCKVLRECELENLNNLNVTEDELGHRYSFIL